MIYALLFRTVPKHDITTFENNNENVTAAEKDQAAWPHNIAVEALPEGRGLGVRNQKTGRRALSLLFPVAYGPMRTASTLRESTAAVPGDANPLRFGRATEGLSAALCRVV